ncbi:member of major facilitator superfamily multidrug-resistance, DHA1 sub-family, partial [Amanita muscaria]
MTIATKTRPTDEETLLLDNAHVLQRTPLPWSQFSIILFLHMAEPLATNAIYPFTPELIRDIGITHGNEKKIGYYVGLMGSLFFLSEAVTVFQWSRLSDHIGRKPVILVGLTGLAVSMYSFGLSTTFLGLVLSKCLHGSLDGNVGVIRSMIAELTDATNVAQAYAYAPIAASTGAILGPLIGGSLSRPADQFPWLFGTNTFLKKYPYFLPCAISATFTVSSLILALIYLKETVKNPIPLSHLIRNKKPALNTDDSQKTARENNEAPLPLRAVMTPQVIIAAGSYAMLALVNTALHSIQPVFFFTPITDGGLDLSPPAIGVILCISGLLNGLLQVFCFAGIHNRWGSRNTLFLGILAAIPVFALFPVMNWLARKEGASWVLIWSALGAQLGFSASINMAYGAIFIIIADAAPNRASLGATNGLSQTAVSVVRSIAPAAANSLYSLSIEKGYLGGNLVYLVLIGVVGIACWTALLLPK